MRHLIENAILTLAFLQSASVPLQIVQHPWPTPDGPIGWELGHSYTLAVFRKPGCDADAGMEYGSPVGWAVSLSEGAHPFAWITGVADQWMPANTLCGPYPDIPETPYAQERVDVPNDATLFGVSVWLQGWGVGPDGGVRSTQNVQVVFY